MNSTTRAMILKKISHCLFSPIDIASLVYFRIAFGALMLWEVWRYFDRGWIHRYFIHPVFHFKYFGFEWVEVWPGQGMYWHFALLGLFAFFILIGFCYRAAALFFFLGFTYVFLLDQATYLNHFYLITLISFLMIFIPAHRAFSVDAKLRPSLRSPTAPAWALWLLRFQIGIVYFYAGVAKLNWDWLHGNPMRQWMAAHADFPVLGRYFTEEWAVYFFCYGGLLFDLMVFPLLLWRKTRVFAFCGALFFHLMNASLFRIGVFPWFMIAATALFFPPDWPRRLFSKRKTNAEEASPLSFTGPLRRGQRLTLFFLGFYLSLQVLIPLRHFLYPGNVSWTEEGHRFSWHMKLRSKRARAEFFATDPVKQKTWKVDPKDTLTHRQYETMTARPDMIHQFCRYLAGEFRKGGGDPVEIRAQVKASLNGRKAQWMVDPDRNLASEPRSLRAASWIVPLQEMASKAEEKMEGDGSFPDPE